MLWRSLSHLERSHMGQLVNSPDWSWGQICEWSSYRQCQPHPFESFQLRSQTWLEQRKNIPSEPWKILHTESVAYCNDYFKLLSLCVLLSNSSTWKTIFVGGGRTHVVFVCAQTVSRWAHKKLVPVVTPRKGTCVVRGWEREILFFHLGTS